MVNEKLKKLVRQKGTPAYIYERAAIKGAYAALRKHLPRDIEIFYAVKANPNKAVVAFLGKLGAGADVASSGELEIALKSGIKPSLISFAGPGKTKEDLVFAIRKKIAAISIESDAEALLVNELSKRMKRVTSVTVRINPLAGSKQAGLRMGGGSQQFGIDEENVPEVVKIIKKCRNLVFSGVHMHTSSQILSEEVIADNIRYLLDFCIRLQNKFDVDIRHVNCGGGLGIPYYAGQKPLDNRKLGLLIKRAFEQTDAGRHLKQSRFIMEPGRYLVGEAGAYVTKVLYKKKSRGKTFLIVDGGMHQNLAAAGLLGEGLRRNRIFGAITKKNTSRREIVTVAGCLCTPLDILARDIELPQCEPGDHLYITCSGAYGYSASPLGFLGHSLPFEIVV